MALTGHSGMHTAQSMHSSGSMVRKLGPFAEAVDGADIDAVGVLAADAGFE
jgi:hypothetical protein